VTAVDHGRRYARIVHGPPVDRVDDPPTRRSPWRVELHEFLAMAANLEAAGFHTGDVLAKIEAIDAAITAAITPDPGRYLSDDLVSLEPAVVAERVRQAGVDLATNLEMARARIAFETRLAADAAKALRDRNDGIVAAMRKRFDPALEVIKVAAKVGLTAHTDAAQLLDTAAPDAIDAYRNLAPAVAELDRIAALRNSMTTVAGLGPVEHPMAALLTDVDDLTALEDAQAVWRGEVETVQVDMTMGSTLVNVRRPRLGGPWLALVTAGYQVRLNTADEADAVLTAATSAGVED